MLYSASLILVKSDKHERFIIFFIAWYIDKKKLYMFALLQLKSTQDLKVSGSLSFVSITTER